VTGPNDENDLRRSLNEEQYAAVTAPDGPLLVLAAAGTGKTRTLVYRVAHLVRRGIRPDRILLLTFTNRASREMIERADSIIGGDVGGMWGGTFHHMANRILRRHAPLLGFGYNFTILDRDDSKSLVSQCAKDLKAGRDELPAPSVLLEWFGAAANTEKPIAAVVETRLSAAGNDIIADPRQIVRAHEAYEKRKRELNGMDFDDLLLNCVRLFRDHPAVLQRYQEQFQHMLVDEYQDTNVLQAEMVDRLAGLHRNLLVVGDDFQSIYSWRGADYRNIMSFPERYPDARIFKLETNYRSVPEILTVANACIAGNPHQFQKVLRPTREAYKKPHLLRLRNGDEQAQAVLRVILRLRRDGYRLQDIAVLYRAHFHALELEKELPRMQMPYIITSGVRFFEQAHIKDVCSLLRVLCFPTDEMAFTRLLGLLPGVGPKTAAKAWEKLSRQFTASDPVQRAAVHGLLPAAAREGWKAIETVLTAATEEQPTPTGGELLRRFSMAYYDAYLFRHYENAQDRTEDVNALAGDIAKSDSLETFLSDVALLTNLDAEMADEDAAPKDMLRLSTIHQAKGLEWPVVIVIWAVEGMFPSSRALNESTEGEAEERRLFYVAVTRAKDELYLCVPELRNTRDGGVFYCKPSRFVEEIPQGYLRELRGHAV
jgi:DNA helicase II / ATP-dependent DNA helicase PcrA